MARTFPKEGVQRLKATIQNLRDQIKHKEKIIRFLEAEINNLVKPVRIRKKHIEKPKMNEEEWRKDFTQRFKKEVLGEK